MHFLNQLAARQAGHRALPHLFGSNRHHSILPESAFEALHVTDYYRFLDSAESFEAPPVAMQLAGNHLGIANDVGDVVVLDKDSLNELGKISAHRSAIFDFKWRGHTEAMSTTQFLTCSGDRSILLWDLNRPGAVLQGYYSAHLGSVKSIAFHDANLFASGGRDGALKFWDLRCNVNALKIGPQFEIVDAHQYSLPSARNSRISPVTGTSLRRIRSSRASPIAVGLMTSKANFTPSNVVTCVGFSPTYNYHLYSSGISDSTVKVWDIRKCSRAYKCAHPPSPVKYYSIKQCTTGTSSIAGHGFCHLIFQHSPKFGTVLLGSATDSKIYAFLGDSIDPIMCYSGRYSNHFSRIAAFGDQYLVSGGNNGRALIWRADLSFPQPPATPSSDRLLLENRLPLYELQFGATEDISLVATDTATSTIYNSTDQQILYKWNFYENATLTSDVLMDGVGIRPTVARFQPETSDSRVISLRRPQAWNVRTSTTPQPSPTVAAASSSKSMAPPPTPKGPLGLITSYIYNCPQQGPAGAGSGSQSEPPTKRQKTTTSSTTKRTPKRPARRSLFTNNRKISEYFLTP